MIKWIFPILALAMFASTLGFGIISPLLPLYAESLGATGIWVGIIFGAYASARVFIMPFIGRISDRRGRKLFLAGGLIAYAIMSIAYIYAANVYHLTIIRVLHGAAAALIFPMAMAYVGDLLPEGSEGKWMGLSNFAFFSGFSFGPFLGGVLSDYMGINSAFWSMAGLNLIAFIIVMAFIPEISKIKDATKHRVTFEEMDNGASAKLEELTEEIGVSPPPGTQSFKEMSASGLVRALFSYRLMFSVGRSGVTAFLPLMAANKFGLSSTQIGTVLTIYMFTMSILGIPLGWVADRFHRRVMVIIGSTISLVCLSLIPFANSYGQLLTVLIAQGFGGAVAMPASSALTVDEGRHFGMGSTMSIFMMAMSIGMGVGPLLCGGIAELWNVESVFYSASGLMLVGIILFAWFSTRRA